jgi:hypothetical protein
MYVVLVSLLISDLTIFATRPGLRLQSSSATYGLMAIWHRLGIWDSGGVIAWKRLVTDIVGASPFTHSAHSIPLLMMPLPTQVPPSHP